MTQCPKDNTALSALVSMTKLPHDKIPEDKPQTHAWTYRKEKIRGADRNLRDIFGLCPSCQKKNFPEKLSKIVVDGGGGDYEKFRLDSIFPTKLTEFVPFIFIISQNCPIVKRILPDWLCLPNKLGGGGAAAPARYAHAQTVGCE
jgi:hypothetical protein